jgi:hypothetical protein
MRCALVVHRSNCQAPKRHRPYSLRRRVRRCSLFPFSEEKWSAGRRQGAALRRPLAGVDGARRAPTAFSRLPGSAASGARAPIDGGGCASRRSTANKPARLAQARMHGAIVGRRAADARSTRYRSLKVVRHRNVTRDDARGEQGGVNIRKIWRAGISYLRANRGYHHPPTGPRKARPSPKAGMGTSGRKTRPAARMSEATCGIG